MLQLINATFPPSSSVSPIPFPLHTSFEGTHGTAPQGATLGLRIDKYRALIMSRALCAATQQHGAVACTTVNLDARQARRLAARDSVSEKV